MYVQGGMSYEKYEQKSEQKVLNAEKSSVTNSVRQNSKE